MLLFTSAQIHPRDISLIRRLSLSPSPSLSLSVSLYIHIFQLSSYPMLSLNPGSTGWAHASTAPPAYWRPLAAAGRQSRNSTRIPLWPRREARWLWGPYIHLLDSVNWCSAVLYPPSLDHHQEYVAVQLRCQSCLLQCHLQFYITARYINNFFQAAI